MWSKLLKIAICVLSVLLIGVCLAAGWLYCYEAAENTMDPDGALTVLEQADGSFLLEWPAGENAGSYRVEVLQGSRVLYSLDTAERSCVLPELPEEKLTLRITSRCPFLWTARSGSETLVAELTLTAPKVTDIAWSVDAESSVVTVSYEMEDGCICSIYRADTGEILAETAESFAALALEKEPVTVNFRVTRFDDNVTYYGYACGSISLEPADFLSDRLVVEWIDRGDNVYTLTWNETKGDGYLVEISQDGGVSWQTLAEMAADQERSYTTPHLKAFESYQIRVSACDGSISDAVAVTTAQQVLYSTIWPIQDLAVYGDPSGTQSVGTASAGTAYCVLEEVDGLFGVRFGDGIGYIDSNYCMINAAEYLGELCAYDILNSYASVYRVHGVDIPQVTGTVIVGYENVQQADGTFLVPVLYPAAQKLLQAALTAREQGYRLKICDSYRPYQATRQIYTLTEKIIDTMLPDGSRTFRAFMTDEGRYRLGNFLAPVTSRHNYGVALDLTLEPVDGEAVQMQTAMHDLSWYSALENNTQSADLLQSIMVEAGFHTLESEWWHFQDGEAFDTLQPAYLSDGVSARCWVKDDFGWRYRLEDGKFLAACTQIIDGISHEFDADGYVH